MIQEILRDLAGCYLPLIDNDYTIRVLQLSKAKADKRHFYKPWCRLYAIRLENNLFIITGGGIKLYRTMNESEELIYELEKMKSLKLFLKSKNIISADDLNEYYERGKK